MSKALQQVLGLSQAPDSGQVWNGGARPQHFWDQIHPFPLRGLCGSEVIGSIEETWGAEEEGGRPVRMS